MKTITCAPNVFYFTWQIDTFIKSFLSNGIKEEDVFILLEKRPDGAVKDFNKLKKKYPSATFFEYAAGERDESYIAGIKPFLMWKFFEAHPELVDEQWFYHDSDICLTNPLAEFAKGKVYSSDCRWYLGLEYLKTKGEDTIRMMLDSTGFTRSMLQDNDEYIGGAQYVMDGIKADWWREIYEKSVKLFNDGTEWNKTWKGEGYALQIWTSEMWLTCWVLWSKNIKTTLSDDLSFSWPTYDDTEWDKHSIFHNSGVTEDMKGFFNKSLFFNKHPRDTNLDIRKDTCGWKYYEIIKDEN